MRIGIDARFLSTPRAGMSRYTIELTRELVRMDGEFHLYCPMPPPVLGWEGGHPSLRAGRFPGRIGKMIWSQTALPLWAGHDQVDLFWGPNHRLPCYLPPTTARVVTIHDLVWKFSGDTMRTLNRFLEKWFMPQAVRQADRIMVDSQSTANALLTEYPEFQEKIRVVPLGATSLGPPGTLASLNTLGINRPYFLFVGTLEPRKNLRRLLAAFASIPQDIRDHTQLVIAGGRGWGGVDLEKLRNEYSLQKQVILAGYVNDTQLATLYTYARFLAMPSLYEGFGLPVVESMRYGSPVLVSDCSSLPEVAGDAGILVNPLSIKSIAEALLILLQNDPIRNDLAAKAKANAERYCWARSARQTMEIFYEAIAQRKTLSGNKYA